MLSSPQEWVTILSRDLEGRIQPGRKNSCGVGVSHPNTCSDWATWLVGHWRKASHSPSGQQVRLRPSLKRGSDPEPWWEAVLHRESRTLSLVPEKGQAQKSHGQTPSAGQIVPHGPFGANATHKMKETFSDCPDRRSAIIWALGALFPVHPFKKKKI